VSIIGTIIKVLLAINEFPILAIITDATIIQASKHQCTYKSRHQDDDNGQPKQIKLVLLYFSMSY